MHSAHVILMTKVNYSQSESYSCDSKFSRCLILQKYHLILLAKSLKNHYMPFVYLIQF